MWPPFDDLDVTDGDRCAGRGCGHRDRDDGEDCYEAGESEGAGCEEAKGILGAGECIVHDDDEVVAAQSA